MAPKVLLLCSDLFFSAKVLETARHTGAEVLTIRGELAEAASREQPSLILVDLDAEALQPIEAIRQVHEQTPSIRIVGFVRHERVELVKAARDAGATSVLARGAFSSKLPELLS